MPAELRRPPRTGVAMAIAGAAICLVVLVFALFNAETVLRGWLAAAFLCTGVPVGAVGLLMMMRLIEGAWTDELIGATEAATILLPLAALALLPVAVGIPSLYVWAEAAPESAFQRGYLTIWFFGLRSLVWFTFLILTALALLTGRLPARRIACVGLIIYALLGSMVAVDWLMSLDPKFHSSGFGLYVLSIQMTTALAAVIPAAVLSEPAVERSGVLGALLLCALLLWAYFAFMQYFILWSGDAPQAAAWYGRRGTGVWGALAYLATALHFVPLFLLFFAPIRRSAPALIALSASVLLGKALEAAWLVLPTWEGTSATVGLAVAAASTLGLSLLFAATFMGGFAVAARLRGSAPRTRVVVS